MIKVKTPNPPRHEPWKPWVLVLEECDNIFAHFSKSDYNSREVFEKAIDYYSYIIIDNMMKGISNEPDTDNS